MSNISKSRGFKVPKYIENVGKSVKTVGLKMVKEKYLPNTSSLIENITNYSKEMIQDTRTSDKGFKAILEKNSAIKNITDAVGYAKDDLLSGKFVNEERASAMDDDFMGDFGDFGFDFEDDLGNANFGMNDDDGGEEGSIGEFNDSTDVSMDAKVTSVMNSKAIAKSSAIISETVFRSGKSNTGAYIAYDKQKTAMNNALLSGLFAQTNNSLSTINNNVGTLISFHNEVSKDYYEKSISALSAIVDPIKNIEGFMKEMTEMKRNMYDDYIRENGPKGSKKNAYNDVLGYGLDPEAFLNNAMGNIKNSGLGGMLSMFEGDMGKMMLSSPLEAIPSFMIGSLLSKGLENSFSKFDKTVGNIFKAANNKLGAMKNAGGIWGQLASIFHVQNNMKTSVSAGGYVKGPIPFDGVTKKAIVDVIAPTLLRIESHLTGKELKNMNYESGQYENLKDTKKRFETELDKPIVSSMSDTRNRMSWIMRDSGLDEGIRKSAEDSFDEILKDLVKNPNKYYNPHKNNTQDLFKGNKKISKDAVKLFDKVWMSMTPEDRISFQSEIADARSSNSDRLETLDKNMSEKGYSVLFDNSIEKTNGKVDAKVKGATDYTRQIRDILVRGIKVYGFNSSETGEGPSYKDIMASKDVPKNSGMKIKSATKDEQHLRFKANLEGSKHAKNNAKIKAVKMDSSKYYDVWDEGEDGHLSNNKVMNTIDKYARKVKNAAVGAAYKGLYGENPFPNEQNKKDKSSKQPKIKSIKGSNIKSYTDKSSWKNGEKKEEETKDSKIDKFINGANLQVNKYVEMFKANKDSIKSFSKGAGISIGAGVLFNSPLLAIGGLTASFIKSSEKAKSMLFGKLGEDGQRQEGGIISPKMQKFLKGAMVNAGGGALASTILSSTFLGGFGLTAPIVGAGIGLLASSEKVKGVLFGGLDEDGNRTGGIISKEMQDKMKKFALPTLGGLLGGGIAGQLLHQFAGFGAMTPFLTGAFGAGLGILSKSDKFNNWMFGEVGEDGKRKGGFDNKMKDFFKKNLGGIGGAFGGMALGGLTIGGPTGMILGSLGGLSLGIMSQSEGVKKYLFGDIDPETQKRKGGLMGQMGANIKSWFTDSIANPFKEAITPIKSAFKEMTTSVKDVFLKGWEDISSSVKDVFKESVGKPLGDLVKEKITTPLKNMITKLIFGAGKIMGTIISAPMKGITAFANSLSGKKDKDLEKDMKSYDNMEKDAEKSGKGINGFAGKFKDFMGNFKFASLGLFTMKKAADVTDEVDSETKGDKEKKKGFFSRVLGKVRKKGESVINGVDIHGKSEEMIQKATEAVDTVKDVVSDLTGKAKDKVKETKDKVLKGADINAISDDTENSNGNIFTRGKNAVMNGYNSIKNSDMGNMDRFKEAFKKVKNAKGSMAKRMKDETAAQWKARIISMADKLTGADFGGSDKKEGTNTITIGSDDEEGGGKKKSLIARLLGIKGGKDSEMSDEEKYKRKSKSSILGRLFGGHGRAVASTDPTPLPLTAGTQANINNFLPNIADTLHKIYKEMQGQLDGTGYNLETIKNILHTQYGSPDVEAKGLKTSRGNKTRRTKFGRMMDMIMSPVSVLIGKPLSILSKFSPMKLIGKAFSLPKMLLQGVFGLPGKLVGGGKALFSLIMKPIELAGKSIAGGVKFLIDVGMKMMSGLTDIVGKSLSHLTTIMGKGLDTITNMVGTLGETVGNVMQSLPGIIASIGGVAIDGMKAVGRGLKTGLELTGKGIGSLIGSIKGINIPDPFMTRKVEVVGGQLDNVKNIDTVSLIKALAGMGPEYVENAETRFMKETDGYKNIKKSSEKDKEGTDTMQENIDKMAKGSGSGIMDKIVKYLPMIGTALTGVMALLSGGGLVNAIRDAFFNKDKSPEERMDAGMDVIRQGNRFAFFGLKTANKVGIKASKMLTKFKGTKLGGLTGKVLSKGKGLLGKAGKSLIDDGLKLGIKGKNILFDILSNSKILKLIGGDKILKKLTPAIKQITAKFGEKMAKGAAKKAAKAGAKASVRTGSRALAATGIGAIVTGIVEAGFMTADFMSGYTSPNRYFKLPKDVEPDKNMRIAAGIGNLISGLLMEVDSFFESDDSPKMFVQLIYNMLASDEEQQRTKEQQKRMQEEFKAFKASSGNEKLTFEEYNRMQNATIWERTGDKIRDYYNKGKGIVGKAKDMYTNVKNKVTDKYNSAKDYIGEKYNSIVDTMKKLTDPKFLGKIVGMGVAHVQKAFDKSVDYIKSIPDRVSKAVSDLGGKLVEGYDKIKDGFKSIWTRITDKVGEIKDSILSIPTKIIDWWNSPGSLLDSVKNLPTLIWQKAIEWKDKIFSFGSNVKDKVRNTAESVKEKATNFLNKIRKVKDDFKEGYEEGKNQVLEEKSGSGFGAGSFISQKSSRYSNIDMSIKGDSKSMKFSDVGCAPASMSMVLNKMGYKSNPQDLAETSKKYRRPNMGTHYSMFKDVASSYGVEANTKRNDGKVRNNDILLGQSTGGSKTPFGKTPHYVVADQVKDDKIKIKDPLSSSSKWYDKNSVLQSVNYITEFGKGEEANTLATEGAKVNSTVQAELTDSGEIKNYISTIGKVMAFFGKLAGNPTEDGEAVGGNEITSKLYNMDLSNVDFSKLPTKDMIFTQDKDKNKRAQYAASIILPRAQAAGHDPSLIMAQWAHETSWGSKAPGNNLFGVKAPKGWTGKTVSFDTHEYYGGKKVNLKDKFKAFDTPEQSVDDYISLIDRLYPNVKKDGAKGLFNSRYGIKGRDYATDPDYINKVITMQNQMRKGFNIEEYGAGSLPSFNIDTGKVLSGLGLNTNNIEKAISIMNGNGKPIKSLSKVNDKINLGVNSLNRVSSAIDSNINNIASVTESYVNAPGRAIESVNREIENKLNNVRSSINNSVNIKGNGIANRAVDQVVGGVTSEITNSVKELTNSVKTLTNVTNTNGQTGITGDNSNIIEALNRQTKLMESMCQMLGALVMNTNLFKVDPKSVEGRRIKTSMGLPIDQPFLDGHSDDLARQLIKRQHS